MPVATNAFKQYLKSEPNMKMGSNAAVNRFIKEGINTYLDLADFDKASLDILAKNASLKKLCICSARKLASPSILLLTLIPLKLKALCDAFATKLERLYVY